MVRYRVIVHGRVQGVWFRGSVQAEAEQTGVAGWAGNRPDGTVAAVFEGDAVTVQQLVSYCETGPPWRGWTA